MQITSRAFINNDIIPEKYTCVGENINPPLQISDAPQGTKSFVLVFLDRDAIPKPWIHWLVFNIPENIREIGENSVPQGAIEGLANSGKPGYKGPCPKHFSEEHQYVFRLYALDTVLNIPKRSTLTTIIEKIPEHILATADLIGDVSGMQQPVIQI